MLVKCAQVLLTRSSASSKAPDRYRPTGSESARTRTIALKYFSRTKPIQTEQPVAPRQPRRNRLFLHERTNREIQR